MKKTHIEIKVVTKEKLEAIAKKESRSMITVATRLIDNEHKKQFDKADGV